MKTTRILSVLLASGGLLALADGHVVFGLIFLAASAAGLWREKKKIAANDYRLNLSLPKSKDENAEFLNGLFEKAVSDYNFLAQAQNDISDPELAAQLAKMQQIAHNFICYLQKQPQKIPLARRFIDYYQDRAVFLVKKYITLEETQLNAKEIAAAKARLKEALNQFDEAYEEQFAKVMDEQLMDIDSELNVMRQVFDSDGIKKDTGSPAEKSAPRPKEKNERLENSIKDFLSFDQRLTAPRCRGKRGWASFSQDRGKVLQKKLIAGALGILLGGIGAHKFYLRKNFWGAAYILFCWTGLPSLIGFVEGVRYIFMPSEDFYRQYLNGK